MPAPSASLATQRPDLAASFEQFDLDASRMGFLGTRILTVIDVPVQAGNFGIIPIEQLLQTRTTLRAPGSAYGRSNWTFKPSTFSTKENGQEEAIDDRERTMYANYFAAEQVAAKRARDAVIRNYEVRVTNLLTSGTTFTGALTSAVTVSWKTFASSDPITDANTAIQAVYANCGFKPDTCVVGFNAFYNARRSASLINQIKYSGIDDPKMPVDVAANLMAQAFGVQRLLVAGAQTNSANEGQAVSLSQVWSNDKIGFYKTDDSQDFKSPCIGRTFHWSADGSSIGGTVESYRDETVRGDVVRVRQDTDEQILYSQMGYVMTGANA